MVLVTVERTLMDNTKESVNERLSLEVTNIIFNREPGWSIKLRVAIITEFANLEKEILEKINASNRNLNKSNKDVRRHTEYDIDYEHNIGLDIAKSIIKDSFKV